MSYGLRTVRCNLFILRLMMLHCVPAVDMAPASTTLTFHPPELMLLGCHFHFREEAQQRKAKSPIMTVSTPAVCRRAS